jgi:hypothetical protein
LWDYVREIETVRLAGDASAKAMAKLLISRAPMIIADVDSAPAARFGQGGEAQEQA